MKNLKLSPPWVIYVNKLKCLFMDDPDITIDDLTDLEDGGYEIKLLVNDQEKADALTKLLPMEKEFGNVILHITIVPANAEPESKVEIFRKAFKNNPIVANIATVTTPFGDDVNYVVFKKEVVQFFNDDISDYNGVCSTLYQTIAKEVFGLRDVNFSTDVE